MEIMGGDYESCKNMIYKLAKERFNLNKKNRPDVEFDDVLGEAYCIYSYCLVNYKGNKGMKFTTYLYQNLLSRLRDYYLRTLKPISHYEDINLVGKDGSVKRYEENIASPNYEIDNEVLFKTAKEELSYEGFIVFKYIFTGIRDDNIKATVATLTRPKETKLVATKAIIIIANVKIILNLASSL